VGTVVAEKTPRLPLLLPLMEASARPSCVVCGEALTARQRLYCSGACKQVAYRRRQRPGAEEEPRLRLVGPELEPTPALDPEADDFGKRLEEALVTRVIGAARVDWKAAAWLLSRRWPGRWGTAR